MVIPVDERRGEPYTVTPETSVPWHFVRVSVSLHLEGTLGFSVSGFLLFLLYVRKYVCACVRFSRCERVPRMGRMIFNIKTYLGGRSHGLLGYLSYVV